MYVPICNIGFSTNGEGKNKILAQVAKPRRQEILLPEGLRILFLPKPLVENPILTN